MKNITLGVAAINTTPLDWEGNLASLKSVIAQAKAKGVRLLCLPELALTGYGCEDAFHAPSLTIQAMTMLVEDLVPLADGIAFNIGLPVAMGGSLYNCSAFVAGKKIWGFVAKQHLAGDGVHYEPRFFKAWQTGRREMITLPNGQLVPIGDLDFDLNGVRVGFEICEDAWVANRPGVWLAQRAVDVILNPSASHFAFGKTHTRQRFVLEGSRAFHCAYAYANLLGNEAGRVIYDGECILAHEGKILDRQERMTLADWTLSTAVVDIDTSRTARLRQTSFAPNFDGPAAVAVAFEAVGAHGATTAGMTKVMGDWEMGENAMNEEFVRAEVLGLWDYLRKAKQKGYAISLSGGADSAVCAALVALMTEAAQAQVPEKLEKILGVPTKKLTTKQIVERLLVCVYQPTKNSSTTTLNAARDVAKEMGARFEVFEVDAILEAYEKTMAKYLGRTLNWDADNLMRQNLQARIRNPGIWAVANTECKLLITTSNRSEAAVGYCTMDGDTAGSLAPIAGVGKPFVLTWMKWASEKKFPALKAIVALKPTAELKPAEYKQTDEADLMPYTILDAIQKAAVIARAGPLEIYQTLQHTKITEGFDAKTIAGWVEKYFRLWAANQWKRERYAPSFHLDDENLDPRSWMRFPILSGGYKLELQKLREYVTMDETPKTNALKKLRANRT